ncbi:MAG TPA: GNAT family N-acetyltransferase, partial [Intrasporangium sp.]|nr:GNAT family N-acetyltransferase [Intrasporangium sp.]
MQEAPNQVLFPRPADVLLSDGSVALIRPLEPADAAGLRTLHEQVSDDSIRLRFFTGNRQAGLDYVEHLLRSTEDTVLTLVVVLRGKVVAVATAEPLSPDSAEVAFLVADSVRGRGIGSLLLEHLAASCRVRGIRHFVADVLSENNLMLRVFADAGFAMSRASEHGVVVFDISTAATPDVVRAADAREFQSEANSLRPLLYPRSVAVVGVRSDGGGIGAGVLDSIVRGGFTGRVYVVHPRAASIAGQSCHRALIDLPEPVDVVLIAVPPAAVAGVLEDAAEAGAGSAVVITSGFGELDPRGRKMQQDLLRIAREHSLRLVGPNCLGVLANDPSTRLNATFTRATPPPGGLAIASQSGGVGIVMLDLAQHLGLGIHSFVSLGNKADVSGNDLLSAWYDDAEVTAAALYLESFGNAPKFARIARRFAERKPLLAVAGGRSTGGVRAGASHTAAAAAPTVGVDALFAQAGVTACSSAEAMARTALLLSEQPLPHGPRVGVVSNAGGIGVLAADSADGQGLVVPELSAPLAARLRGLVNGTVGTSNPIDLGA